MIIHILYIIPIYLYLLFFFFFCSIISTWLLKALNLKWISHSLKWSSPVEISDCYQSIRKHKISSQMALLWIINRKKNKWRQKVCDTISLKETFSVFSRLKPWWSITPTIMFVESRVKMSCHQEGIICTKHIRSDSQVLSSE